mmetsp:Transcript_8946/g.23688  ORF Transcript_8946/g.23688 Transcript_8946/m.23688 type:complete len:227 (+) Transcript_8946:3-683(+)
MRLRPAAPTRRVPEVCVGGGSLADGMPVARWGVAAEGCAANRFQDGGLSSGCSSPRLFVSCPQSWALSEAASPSHVMRVPTPMRGRVALPMAVIQKDKQDTKVFEDALARAWAAHEAEQEGSEQEQSEHEEDERQQRHPRASRRKSSDDSDCSAGSVLGQFLFAPLLRRLGLTNPDAPAAESSGWRGLCFPKGVSGFNCQGGPQVVGRGDEEMVLDGSECKQRYAF